MLLTREDGYDKASESPWAGVPALIEEVNGSTIFRYQNNDVKDKYGKKSAQDFTFTLNFSILTSARHSNMLNGTIALYGTIESGICTSPEE